MARQHHDAVPIASRRRTPDGALILTARIADSAPLQYPTGVERNAPSALAQIAAQALGLAVTVNHPARMLRDGAQARIVGRVASARVDGDAVLAEIVVDDRDAIAAVESGRLRAVSLGYLSDGLPIRQAITADHLALVDAPRCTACVIRVDDCGCGCGGKADADPERAAFRALQRALAWKKPPRLNEADATKAMQASIANEWRK